MVIEQNAPDLPRAPQEPQFHVVSLQRRERGELDADVNAEEWRLDTRQNYAANTPAHHGLAFDGVEVTPPGMHANGDIVRVEARLATPFGPAPVNPTVSLLNNYVFGFNTDAHTMYDDGTHGDSTPNDGVYTLDSLVIDIVPAIPDLSQPYGPLHFFVQINEDGGRTLTVPVGITVHSDNFSHGACCVPGNGCVVTSRTNCAGLGGTWDGPGTACINSGSDAQFFPYTVYGGFDDLLILHYHIDLPPSDAIVGPEGVTIQFDAVADVFAQFRLSNGVVAVDLPMQRMVPAHGLGPFFPEWLGEYRLSDTATRLHDLPEYPGAGHEYGALPSGEYRAPILRQFAGQPFTGRWTLSIDWTEGIPFLNALSIASNPARARCCPADLNRDGNLDPDDLADYIAAYFASPAQVTADWNADGNIDPDDLSDYIAAYFGGC